MARTKPTAKYWYDGWNDAANTTNKLQKDAVVDGGDEAGDDAPETDTAKAGKNAADEKIAKLKKEEAFLSDSVALYKRHPGASTDTLISTAEENLKVCRQALLLSRPASTRVSQLTRAEKNWIR